MNFRWEIKTLAGYLFEAVESFLAIFLPVLSAIWFSIWLVIQILERYPAK